MSCTGIPFFVIILEPSNQLEENGIKKELQSTNVEEDNKVNEEYLTEDFNKQDPDALMTSDEKQKESLDNEKEHDSTSNVKV